MRTRSSTRPLAPEDLYVKPAQEDTQDQQTEPTIEELLSAKEALWRHQGEMLVLSLMQEIRVGGLQFGQHSPALLTQHTRCKYPLYAVMMCCVSQMEEERSVSVVRARDLAERDRLHDMFEVHNVLKV